MTRPTGAMQEAANVTSHAHSVSCTGSGPASGAGPCMHLQWHLLLCRLGPELLCWSVPTRSTTRPPQCLCQAAWRVPAMLHLHVVESATCARRTCAGRTLQLYRSVHPTVLVLLVGRWPSSVQ
jgi:hypothetical protein